MDLIELSEPDIINMLGKRLRQYRLACRMTQDELASRAGVTSKTVSLFESGRGKNITMVNFLSIMRATDLLNRIDELIPEIPENPYVSHRTRKQKDRVRKSQQ